MVIAWADSSSFGLAASGSTLAEFLDEMPQANHSSDSAPRQYIFGVTATERLTRDIGEISFVNESEYSLDTFQCECSAVSSLTALPVSPRIVAVFEGYVGPRASGAQVHYHGDAVNLLVYGRKRWALLPPGIAEYSKAPAAEWFATRLPELLDAQAGVVQCIQEGGEAMYVPAGWGKTP